MMRSEYFSYHQTFAHVIFRGVVSSRLATYSYLRTLCSSYRAVAQVKLRICAD